MFCTSCGTKMINGELFCTHCGQALAERTHEKNDSPVTQDLASIDPEIQAVVETSMPVEDAVSEAIAATEEQPKSKKKWLFAGIAVLLLIVAGGGFFLTSMLSPSKEPTRQAEALPDAAKNADPVDKANAIESVGLEHLNIHEVNQTDFPFIKLTINVGDAIENVFEAIDFTITEEGEAQSIEDVEYAKEKKLITLSYSSKKPHRNPGSIDKRNVAIALLDKQSETSYEAPQPLTLRMDDISYNTDQYPDINVYFSLYDAYDKLVETLPADANLFKVAENNIAQQISEIAKMSDAKESLSINVVMDDSSSMSNIVDRVKQEALQFLEHITMTSNDRIALMSFAGASEIIQNDFTNDTRQVVSELQALNTNGSCTALYRAIEQAVYNTAYNGETGSKYVVVFTDGGENCSNEGFENQDFLNPRTVINTANQLGIPIYAVGVDQDDQLQAITKETNGEYISIGSDIEQLGQFYESIFTKKKAQYVVKYRSEIAKKTPRTASLSVQNERYFSKGDVTVTPRLIHDQGLAKAMDNYQVNWSASMSSGDISYLAPYVTYDNTSKSAVYKIVYDQLISLNDAKANGNETVFGIPIYQLLDAAKVSDTLYQLQIKKYFKRTIFNNGTISSIRYKSTAYTYNVVKQNDVWLVDSTVDTKVPEACYTDETYTVTAACK